MRPPALGNVIGSATEVQAGSIASELERRSTPVGASVVGSRATTMDDSVGEPAMATIALGPDPQAARCP